MGPGCLRHPGSGQKSIKRPKKAKKGQIKGPFFGHFTRLTWVPSAPRLGPKKQKKKGQKKPKKAKKSQKRPNKRAFFWPFFLFWHFWVKGVTRLRAKKGQNDLFWPFVK